LIFSRPDSKFEVDEEPAGWGCL